MAQQRCTALRLSDDMYEADLQKLEALLVVSIEVIGCHCQAALCVLLQQNCPALVTCASLPAVRTCAMHVIGTIRGILKPKS